MKYLLLAAIKVYWILKPKKKQGRCIFYKSCSKYVFDITKQEGFNNGFKALVFRMKNCNPNFDICTDFKTERKKMFLYTGEIMDEKYISRRLIK